MLDTTIINVSGYIPPFKPAAKEVFTHYPNGLNTPLGASSIEHLLVEAAVNNSATSPRLYLAHTDIEPSPENVIGVIGWQSQLLLPGHFTLGAFCVVEPKRGQGNGSRLMERAIAEIAAAIPNDVRIATILLEQGGTSNERFYKRHCFKPWRNNIMYRDVPNPKFAAE